MGPPKTDLHARFQFIAEHLVKEAGKDCGYEVTFPPLKAPVVLDVQLIECLANADLVVADVTDNHVNVFYELGLCHALGKPTIQIAEERTRFPFYIDKVNTLSIPPWNTFRNTRMLRGTDTLEKLKGQLATKIRLIEDSPAAPNNAVHVYRIMQQSKAVLPSSADVGKVTNEVLAANIQAQSERLEEVLREISGLPKRDGLSLDPSSLAIAKAEFLNTDGEAFRVLTDVTSRAKNIIYATRFFEGSVLGETAYVDAMIGRVTGNDGREPLRKYARIIALNHTKKLEDVKHHLSRFRGRNFELFITTHENTFELVIVDDIDVFVHFHANEKPIGSSLHLIGNNQLVGRFCDIFQKLKKIDVVWRKNCRDLVDNKDVARSLGEIEKIWQREMRRKNERS